MDFKKVISKQIIISAALVAVFAGVVFTLGFDIKNRANEYIAVKKKIRDDAVMIGSLAHVQSDFELVKKYLPQVDSYLVNKDQLLNFTKDINSIAKQNNMGFDVVFGQETPLTEVEPRSTSISLFSQSAATIDNQIKFMELLENSRYFIKLDALDANYGSDQMKINLTGKVYSF